MLYLQITSLTSSLNQTRVDLIHKTKEALSFQEKYCNTRSVEALTKKKLEETEIDRSSLYETVTELQEALQMVCCI